MVVNNFGLILGFIKLSSKVLYDYELYIFYNMCMKDN